VLWRRQLSIDSQEAANQLRAAVDRRDRQTDAGRTDGRTPDRYTHMLTTYYAASVNDIGPNVLVGPISVMSVMYDIVSFIGLFVSSVNYDL